MIQLFLDKRGAVSVFLTIILVPVIVVTSLFVDASRLRLAKGVVSSAGDLTLNTMLTQYDATLNDYYGMLASCQDIDQFLATANDYFTACIASQGIELDDARKYADEVSGLLNGEGGEIVDLLQIAITEGGEFKVYPMTNGDLANAALVKKEIVEFMKYRAPINAVGDLIEKFRDAGDDLTDAEDNADLVEKKQDYYEAEGEIVRKAWEAYKELLLYKEENITVESVNELKSALNGIEEKYKGFHSKMVKDLYNTQDLNVFNAQTIINDYTVSEGEVNTEQVNSYINNAAKAIKDFINAAERLDNSYANMPKYEAGAVYDIQYWAACNEILEQNSNYSNYVRKANSLIENMEILIAVMELIDETGACEEYTLANYDGVNTKGRDTRANHFEKLKSQYAELQIRYLKNNNSAYARISNDLSRISRDNINNINTADTDTGIKQIHTTLNKHYESYDKAMDHLSNAVDKLRQLKRKVDEYNEALGDWSNAASSYTTEMAGMDRSEISTLKTEIREKVTEQNVDELIQRINNVKSLLGSLKTGIDGMKYNDYEIRKIDSYSTFKKKSGVDEKHISYLKEKLRIYVDESFDFTSTTTLEELGITNNNNPAIDSVNTPELYKWFKTTFPNGKIEDTEKQIEKEEDKYDEIKKNKSEDEEDKTKYFGSSNEINGMENLPSGVATDDEGYEGDNDIGKVSSFVSNLFGNFSETVGKALVDVRDSLFTLEYVMDMFSYDTYEYEAKFEMLEGKVNLANCNEKYNSIDLEWQNAEDDFRRNKSLTNKMINAQNNFSYGNEVEYILYGKKNEENKDAAYGTIFAIRYVLDLMPMFMRYFSRIKSGDTSKSDVSALDALAHGIQTGSYGIIPASLVKVVAVLGLTAAEAARDIKYLSKGMPVELVKSEDDIECKFEISVDNDNDQEANTSGFFYSDYLKLILILKLNNKDAEYGIYGRVADVIQANMGHITSKTYLMKNAKVYYQATASVQVKPLMLSLPLINNSGYSAPESGSWNQIDYKAKKGY